MIIYKKHTFTLIEMLIVVVIIGILAAALIPRLQGAQERARDIKRKADVKNILSALQLYYQDNQDYPKNHSQGRGSRCVSTKSGFMSMLRPSYLSSIPLDPINKENPNIDPTNTFWTSRTAHLANLYYVYYRYDPSDPWDLAASSGCSFYGKVYSIIGAFTLETEIDKKNSLEISCPVGHSRTYIDYPMPVISQGNIY